MISYRIEVLRKDGEMCEVLESNKEEIVLKALVKLGAIESESINIAYCLCSCEFNDLFLNVYEVRYGKDLKGGD